MPFLKPWSFVSLFLLTFILSPLLDASAQDFVPDPEAIIGGTEVTPGSYPFMVAILDSSGDAESQFCGASLISSTWVLTAAHCMKDGASTISPSSIRVGLGLHSLSTGGGTVNTVKRIIVHPSYSASTQDNDIALIELNSSASQSPIVLHTGSTDLTGTTARAIGWGLTNANNNNSRSDVLLQVDLPVVSSSSCNSAYGGGITDRMICAGYSAGGQDACQGDSGGPLFATISGVRKQIGVTSFGEGCAQPNTPGVYSRVSQFESFIAQYVTLTPPTPTDGKFGLWNGFLGMTNIVELINPSGSAITAQVNMFSSSGTLVSSNFYAVPANGQQDVIVNELSGYASDTYGILQVSSNVDGRVVYYRPNEPTMSNFDFAFAVPLRDGMTGDSFVGFNTFQPSFNISDSANVVANWLSIVNLSSSTQGFFIRRYDSAGNLLTSTAVNVEAKSRADFEAGHVLPGPSNVGLVKIEPMNGSAAYLSLLMRYGYGPGGGFDFAFPLIADSGSTSTLTVPLGSQFLAQNWLEVINVGNATNLVLVDFYNAAGNLLGTLNVGLGARSQYHIDVTSILGAQQFGYARIHTSSGQPVVAESMFYYRNSANGSILSMYGSQSRVAPQGTTRGSYNLFLGMSDYLKIMNPSDQALSLQLTVTSSFSAGVTGPVSIGPNGSVEFLLNSAAFGTIASSYGVVTLTPTDSSQRVLSEVLRLRVVGSDIQFAAPTPVE